MFLSNIYPNGIKFKNGIEAMFESAVAKLIEAAPSDASVTSQIIKLKDGYKGILSLASTEGKFEAVLTSNTIEDLVKDLVTQVGKRISCWKKLRTFPGCEEHTT